MLPDELLLKIISLLPQSELKAARLTCSRWRNLGAELLFERVYCAPRKLTLERLSHIAEISHFCRYVRELVYDGHAYLRNDAAISTYQRLYEEQDEILRNGMDSLILQRCLERMPKLSKVSLIDVSDVPENRAHSWYDLQSATELGDTHPPRTWGELIGYSPGENSADYFRPMYGVVHLFKAIEYFGHNVRHLCIGSSTSGAPLVIFDVDSPIARPLENIIDRLTSLTIDDNVVHLNIGILSDPRRTPPQIIRLGSILTKAQNLRYLNCNLSVLTNVQWNTLQGQPWHKLVTLVLRFGKSGLANLEPMLSANRESLREVVLRFARGRTDFPNEGQWDAIGDVFGKYLRLRRLDICMRWYGNRYVTDLEEECLPDELEGLARRIMRWVPTEALKVDQGPTTVTAELLTSHPIH